MTSYYSDLIKLNNHGAQLLQAGRLDEAADLFSKAVRFARSFRQSSSIEEEQSPLLYGVEFSLDSILSINSSSPLPHVARTTVESNDNENARFLYREPVFISDIAVSSGIPHTAISLAIVFNLALTHHLNALCLGSRAHLLKATKLYELSYRMQMTSKVIEPSLFLAMIVLNNQGHIQSAVGNYAGAERYFFQLLSSMGMKADGEEELEFPESEEDNLMNLLRKSAWKHLEILKRNCAAAA